MAKELGFDLKELEFPSWPSDVLDVAAAEWLAILGRQPAVTFEEISNSGTDQGKNKSSKYYGEWTVAIMVKFNGSIQGHPGHSTP